VLGALSASSHSQYALFHTLPLSLLLPTHLYAFPASPHKVSRFLHFHSPQPLASSHSQHTPSRFPCISIHTLSISSHLFTHSSAFLASPYTLRFLHITLHTLSLLHMNELNTSTFTIYALPLSSHSQCIFLSLLHIYRMCVRCVRASAFTVDAVTTAWGRGGRPMVSGTEGGRRYYILHGGETGSEAGDTCRMRSGSTSPYTGHAHERRDAHRCCTNTCTSTRSTQPHRFLHDNFTTTCTCTRSVVFSMGLYTCRSPSFDAHVRFFHLQCTNVVVCAWRRGGAG
jgi:hypothetical protein